MAGEVGTSYQARGPFEVCEVGRPLEQSPSGDHVGLGSYIQADLSGLAKKQNFKTHPEICTQPPPLAPEGITFCKFHPRPKLCKSSADSS